MHVSHVRHFDGQWLFSAPVSRCIVKLVLLRHDQHEGGREGGNGQQHRERCSHQAWQNLRTSRYA